MSESGTDPVVQAATRLEMAVERLGRLTASRLRELAVLRSEPGRGGALPGGGIPREAVLAVAERLDATIARLRAALGEEGAAAVLDEPPEELAPDDLPPDEIAPEELAPEDMAGDAFAASAEPPAGDGFPAAPFGDASARFPESGPGQPQVPHGEHDAERPGELAGGPDPAPHRPDEAGAPDQQDHGRQDHPGAPDRQDHPGAPDRQDYPGAPDRRD